MRALIIGTGAAGNKAAIELLNRKFIAPEDLLLVNSTLRDIPEEYRGYATQLSDEHEGCGKERDFAKDLTLKALQTGKLDLKKSLLPEHEKIIIITSIEGGTGSGSSVIIAKYCNTVLQKPPYCNKETGIPVEIIGFKGFEADTRGLQNTVEWFQDLDKSYSIQTICNASFLKEANGNRLRAEKLANEELCKRLSLSLGLVIEEAEQNIDPTDIFKVANTTGYTTVEYIKVDEKIKSFDQFNAIVKVGLDETRSLESEDPNATRLGIIFNLQPSSQEYIDYSYSVVKDRFGKHLHETFPHIQYDPNQEEFIGIIVSGMRLPIEEVKKVFQKYQEESDALNTEDNFFEEIRSLRGNAKDSQFNMFKKPIITEDAQFAEDEFFKEFSTTKNDKKKPSDKSEY